MKSIDSDKLVLKNEDSWSIVENVGHILDLEPLWFGRLSDILNGEKVMREADLENKKTHNANHNQNDVWKILMEFESSRRQTLESLKTLDDDDLLLSSLHPRLMQPMRIIDLFYFVAEHDEHHCNTILTLRNLLQEYQV